MPEAVARRCSAKKLFLKTLQNSQENTCVGVSFSIKWKASGNSVFFSVNFAKMLRAHFYLISVKSCFGNDSQNVVETPRTFSGLMMLC